MLHVAQINEYGQDGGYGVGMKIFFISKRPQKVVQIGVKLIKVRVILTKSEPKRARFDSF